MSSQTTTAAGSGKRTLQKLRREAGYSNANDFAKVLGIPGPTYSRYERQPESPDCKIPMGAAWKIADALGCSIDLIVGHANADSEGTRVQRMYDALTPGSRARLDEYLDFIEYREHMIASQGKWS